MGDGKRMGDGRRIAEAGSRFPRDRTQREVRADANAALARFRDLLDDGRPRPTFANVVVPASIRPAAPVSAGSEVFGHHHRVVS
jgi:hypothetical protein